LAPKVLEKSDLLMVRSINSKELEIAVNNLIFLKIKMYLLEGEEFKLSSPKYSP
jgi:hypothetical protein